MNSGSNSFSFYFLAAPIVALVVPSPLSAVGIDFDEAAYEGSPGDTVELVVTFDAPVPDGLEAYGLRLTFPEGIAALTANDISVVAALDHGLFEGGADRRIAPGYATVSGFTELGGGPYTGTAFAAFTITIPGNAPAGSYPLELGLADPGGNNFIDGNTQVIDDELVFGSAAITIAEAGSSRLRVTAPPFFDSESGNVTVFFGGDPGGSYRIEASTALDSWTPLATVVADAEGDVEYEDTDALNFDRRFYRMVED